MKYVFVALVAFLLIGAILVEAAPIKKYNTNYKSYQNSNSNGGGGRNHAQPDLKGTVDSVMFGNFTSYAEAKATVRNIGHADAQVFNVYIVFLDSSGNNKGSCNIGINGLADGKSTIVSCSVSKDNLPHGSYKIAAMFDDTGVVSESNENNNVATLSFSTPY
ncbi:MAG TPA: CARDB domain-containing protein [archaeon]|nr:CARDB domain-containing protein [archaeon]